VSSHETKATSLNQVLEIGPNLLPEIFVILLRFSLHFAAIISDITQASIDPRCEGQRLDQILLVQNYATE